MKAKMWYENNTLGNDYKEAYNYWLGKQIHYFLWHSQLKDELDGTTPKMLTYITDMLIKENFYNELCVDLL